MYWTLAFNEIKCIGQYDDQNMKKMNNVKFSSILPWNFYRMFCFYLVWYIWYKYLLLLKNKFICTKKKKLTNVGTSDQNSMVVNRAKAVRIFDFFVDFIN